MSLLTNRPLDLTLTNDQFGTGGRAYSIKVFLEGYCGQFSDNNMFALYGGWGTGKSSVLKFIEREINKEKFRTLFFDTWEYEKDDNLPLSLLSSMAELLPEEEKIKQDLYKAAIILFKSFFKAITIKPLIGIEFSNEKYLKAAEEELKDIQDSSFHAAIRVFKNTFLEFEEKILGKDNDKKLLIIIDDIDRCEPENVLNLISAIKLFFTYGSRAIFLFALDENAVYTAIKTKYSDTIKAEEYLEKVFDVTFDMPKINPTGMLLRQVFPKQVLHKGQAFNVADKINDFFQAINFNTPRHIKKIVNKYQVLLFYKKLNDPMLSPTLLPNLVDGDQGSIQETIICIFIMILYDYYPTKFKEFDEYEDKLIKYKDIIKQLPQNGIFWRILQGVIAKSKKRNITLNQLSRFENYNSNQGFEGRYGFYVFLSLFMPAIIDSHYDIANIDREDNIVGFITTGERDILLDFTNYISKEKFLFTDISSNYIFEHFFQMAKLFL